MKGTGNVLNEFEKNAIKSLDAYNFYSGRRMLTPFGAICLLKKNVNN